MQMLKSAGEVRGFIESIFVRLDDMVGDSVKNQAYGGLDEKRRSFSGPAYLDQIEKNAIYLSEGARAVSAAIAHYLCAGEPLLSPEQVSQFVFSASTAQAQHTTPSHLSFVRTGSCPGCEVHSEHRSYSGWRDLRKSGDWPKYVEEMEFSYVFYQSLFITGKTLLNTLLLNHQTAGIARWVPAAEVLDVVRERIDIRANVWSGNMKLEVPGFPRPGSQQDKAGTDELGSGRSVSTSTKPRTRSLWERLGFARAAKGTEIFSNQAPSSTQAGGAVMAEEHINHGFGLLAQGQLKEAISEFQTALRIDRNSAMAHGGLGLVYRQQGRLRKSVSQFKTALSLNPMLASAHNSLGLTYAQQGRLKQAVGEFQAALRINPNDADVHYQLGSVYELLGRTNDAVSEYQVVLHLNPEYPGAHYRMGIAYTTQERWDEAVREWQAELRVDPSAAETHVLLAVGYQKLGRIEEAKREFQLAERAGFRPSHGWSDSVEKMLGRNR